MHSRIRTKSRREVKIRNITEFYDKLKNLGYPVAYRCFAEGDVPNAPFIVYYENGTNNFSADGIVYQNIKEINVELYTEVKMQEIEEKIEQLLTENKIFWEKEEYYIESERYIETLYTITI